MRSVAVVDLEEDRILALLELHPDLCNPRRNSGAPQPRNRFSNSTRDNPVRLGLAAERGRVIGPHETRTPLTRPPDLAGGVVVLPVPFSTAPRRACTLDRVPQPPRKRAMRKEVVRPGWTGRCRPSGGSRRRTARPSVSPKAGITEPIIPENDSRITCRAQAPPLEIKYQPGMAWT